METRSRRKAGLQLAPPEGVLTDPTSRSPIDPEDLGLAAMMGDREVPLVGGDQTAVRGPTSGPEDIPAVSEQVPTRELDSDFSRAPSIRSSLEPAESAAVTTAVGQAQQRPVTPPLTTSRDTGEARHHTREARNPTLVSTAAARNPTLVSVGTGAPVGLQDWPPRVSEYDKVKAVDHAYNYQL